MKNVQKMGGFAALYLAVAYAIGIPLFLVILDYPHIVEPAQKVALLADQPMVIYLTNLLLYVLFGVFLVVLRWPCMSACRPLHLPSFGWRLRLA